MINQEVINYIKQRQAQGDEETEIIKDLQNNGWQANDIKEALREAKAGQIPVPMTLGKTEFPGGLNLLKEAFKIYKERLKTFLGFIAIYYLLTVVLVMASLLLFNSAFTTTGKYGEIYGMISVLGFIVLFFVLVLVPAWWQVSLLYAIRDKSRLKESFLKGLPKVLTYLWVTIILTIIISGGWFLFLVPGFLFAIWFSLALFVFIDQGDKGMNALLKSKAYVKGYFGKVFWRFLLFGLLTSIIVLILQWILKNITNSKNISLIISLCVSFVLMPLAYIYGYLIYENLKKIKGLISVPLMMEKQNILS